MAFLPHRIESDSPSASYGASFRAGVGLGVGAFLRCDLGAGYDWVRPNYTAGGPERIAAYRVAFRLGPAEIGGVKAALSALVEYTPQSFVYEGVTNISDVRPGLALELWWR